MTHTISLPAITLMNKLSFSKKFILLSMIIFISVSVALFSLYSYTDKIINSSQKELAGLTLTKPLIKTVQLLQQHRGLSSGVLSGVHELDNKRIEKENLAIDAFSKLVAYLPENIKELETWKNITQKWQAIRLNGMTWSQSENFIVHTQLIDEMLFLESLITDNYELTTDGSLDTFYLTHTTGNELLVSIEHLGQIRAYGTAILGSKEINEQKKTDVIALVTLLQYSLKPLKTGMDKVVRYNPALHQELTKTYDNIHNASQSVIKEVYANVLRERFSISAVDYFLFTTDAINDSYIQLYDSLLPTAEKLIQARIQRVQNELYITVMIASVLSFLAAYFMWAVRSTTLGSISILTNSVLNFARGDMSERVHLDTHDELTTIGNGFNTMADELTALMAARQAALDLLTKITHSVPGMLYQYRLRPDGSSCFPFASDGIREIYQVNPEDVLEDASQIFGIIYPEDLESLNISIQTSAQNLTLWNHEYRVKLNDGSVKWLLGNAIPESEIDGSTLWHGFITDITERKAVEVKLRMLSTAIEQSPTSVAIANLDAEIEYVNPRFTQVTGYTLAEVSGRNPRFLQSGLTSQSVYQSMWESLTQNKRWKGEFINKRKNGEIYYEEAYISPVQDNNGKVSHYVAVKLDITARKQMEDEISQLAFYDPLTHLPNRRLLHDRLKQAILSNQRHKIYGALMFLDLDNFKPLNDTHGHLIGDMLLVEAAKRLQNCVRDMDTVARLGGDEFVVMLATLASDKTNSKSQAAIVAEKIRVALSDAYHFTVHHDAEPDYTVEHFCTGSIGVALFNGNENSQEDIMKWADIAMYQAKDAGRNQIRFHSD
jgi:diguanylate cyclase (GGDEF)-like protein/PAS domain S-box-containing protein